jgi:hypothetical protein
VNELLLWLEEWYLSNCNGDWEHTYGVKIDTLDNPGWSIVIDLDETQFVSKEFLAVEIERSEKDWIFCKIENNKFKAACGCSNLLEGLEIFRKWITSQ